MVLLRHGHSEWNSRPLHRLDDIPLTEVGLVEAAAVGQRLMQRAGFRRGARLGAAAQPQTAEALLATMARPSAAVTTGVSTSGITRCRHEQARNFRDLGQEASRRWWRGYIEPPPPLDRDDPRHPRFDPLYAG